MNQLMHARFARRPAGLMIAAATIGMCGLLPAQDTKTTKPTASAIQSKTMKPIAPAKTTKPGPPRLTIPKDAVETTPGFYKWTDANGKAWIYRRSPFGVSRWPASNNPAYEKQESAGEDSSKEHITAVEHGDSIQFQQNTPFGKRTWVRKKSELTDNEKSIWEAQQKRVAATRGSEKE